MKVHNLSQSSQSPCYLLEYKNVKILLDCALEISSILNFLPKNINYQNFNSNNNNNNNNDILKDKDKDLNKYYKNINGTLYIDNGCSSIKYNCPLFEMINDFSTIDVILISNYTNIYSLPFITEYTNFKGKIYATEPTVQIGKLLLEELVSMDKLYSNSNGNGCNEVLNDGWQSREVLEKMGVGNVGVENENQYRDSYRWRELYKKIDIEKSFEKIQTVRYNESIGFYGFECSPCSSGFGLGSSNWVIESKGYEKLVYMSDSSLSQSRYPTPFQLDQLMNPDVLICSKLNSYPKNPPDEMLSELSGTIGSTLQQGGTVLIPSYSCGIILDLFEHLSEYLVKIGLPFVPIYFVSSISKAVLSYADIYSEWLNKSKQSRAFMPEPPFLHSDLMRKGQFQAYPHIHSNFMANDPCVIFTGHPSCRFGDITSLIKLYDNPKNSILLIEPDFNFKATVLPFSKQISRISFLPIDPRINFNEANILISKLQPKQLIIPNIYKNFIKNKHLNSGNIGLITTILPLDIIKIDNQQKFESAFLDKELAQSIQTRSIDKQIKIGNSITATTIQVAEISGVLSMNDHELLISPANINDSNKIVNIKEKYIWGKLILESIIKQISMLGYQGIEYYEINETYYQIKITSPLSGGSGITNVHLSPYNVNIETDNETTRKQISDIILLNCNGLHI